MNKTQTVCVSLLNKTELGSSEAHFFAQNLME